MSKDFDNQLKKAWEKYKHKKKKKEEHAKAYEKYKRDESFAFFKSNFKSIISIPIIIGVIAAIVMYYRFGWIELEKTLLSWTIGLTLLATIVTLLERYTKLLKL